MDKDVKLVVAIFEGVSSAEVALKEVKGEISDGKFNIQAALAMANRQGGIRYTDVGLTPAKGAVGGLLLGGVVGFLTGGTVLVLGALGGLIGGMLGQRKRESRIESVQVNQVLAAIDPGSSALLLVVGEQGAAALGENLESLQAEVYISDVPEELAAELQKYHEEAYATLDSYLGSPD
jgi:uncharacterized membrane protein